MAENENDNQAANPPAPLPPPILPDPVMLINQYDTVLKSLAEEEKRLRDELGTKDPLESNNDTVEFATELLMVIRAIVKVKQERGAALRRLASGF